MSGLYTTSYPESHHRRPSPNVDKLKGDFIQVIERYFGERPGNELDTIKTTLSDFDSGKTTFFGALRSLSSTLFPYPPLINFMNNYLPDGYSIGYVDQEMCGNDPTIAEVAHVRKAMWIRWPLIDAGDPNSTMSPAEAKHWMPWLQNTPFGACVFDFVKASYLVVTLTNQTRERLGPIEIRNLSNAADIAFTKMCLSPKGLDIRVGGLILDDAVLNGYTLGLPSGDKPGVLVIPSWPSC